jgi:nonsense-mediated mRNA decay protein 3
MLYASDVLLIKLPVQKIQKLIWQSFNVRCALCGRESDRSLCARCYAERNSIVEVGKVRVETCPRCGFYRVGGRWRDISYNSAVEESLRKSLVVHPEFEVKEVELFLNGDRGYVKLKGKLWGEELEQFCEFKIYIKKILCERCSREAGGYYESIVQLRAKNRKLSREEIEITNSIVVEVINGERENMKAFLTKVVERKEGVDYYIGSRDIGRKISRKIAERFGGTITESKKICGRKDGRDIFRFTYSVRLPEYRKGDIVKYKDRLVYITNPRLGRGISIPEMNSVSAGGRVVVKREEIEEGIAVNVDDYAAEIIKTESGETVVAESTGNVKVGDTVNLFKYKGKYYLIPKLI